MSGKNRCLSGAWRVRLSLDGSRDVPDADLPLVASCLKFSKMVMRGWLGHQLEPRASAWDVWGEFSERQRFVPASEPVIKQPQFAGAAGAQKRTRTSTPCGTST